MDLLIFSQSFWSIYLNIAFVAFLFMIGVGMYSDAKKDVPVNWVNFVLNIAKAAITSLFWFPFIVLVVFFASEDYRKKKHHVVEVRYTDAAGNIKPIPLIQSKRARFMAQLRKLR